ncbi:MAG TPA: hypothetical protein EYN15_06130, partial [Chromatiales bacterium]|nr:hypothetical protein [Chromatiales bacterium]
MRVTINKSLLAIAVSSVLVAPIANATNGYFAHGYSTKEKGLAGAGTAYSQDAMAAATNPAGMAFVGARMDIGAALFSPSDRGYTVTGDPPYAGGSGVNVIVPPGVCNPFFTPSGACAPPFSVDTGSATSDNDWFVIPHFAYNWQLSSDTTAGISIYGNGGMNTEYQASGSSATLPDSSDPDLPLPIESLPGVYGDGTAGVNLEQLFFNVSFSKKLDSKSAVGASVIVAAQRFAAQGLSNFGQFSLDPENLTSNKASSSFGAGVKVGYQGELDSGLRVGVSYQSKISMSEFDDYAGLFAEGGDFDIPSTYNIGIAYDVGNSGVVIADIQRINFSDVASLSNPISRLTDGSCSDALNLTLAAGGVPTPAAGAGCLGGANGAGFGWDDITIIKVGYQFESG